MTDIVEQLEKFGSKWPYDAALAEIQSLHQQLDEAHNREANARCSHCGGVFFETDLSKKLAECQARQVEAMGTPDAPPINLNTLKRQWQREALLEAADWCKEDSERLEGAHDFDYAIGMNIAEDKLRSMAKELE
jgi:hypothetical protein